MNRKTEDRWLKVEGIVDIQSEDRWLKVDGV